MKKFSLYILSLVLFLWSCEQENIDLKPLPQTPPVTETPDKGSADFSKYVAIGNSLTAGFQAGALFTEGQENSLAALLAKQFALVGGGEFNQPDINSVNGYNTAVASPEGMVFGRLILAGNPVAPTPTAGDLPTPYAGDKSKLNNFGVPGILLGQALSSATGGPAVAENPAYNPLYARFASNPGASTIIGDAVAAQGTFFSFWLGNNDVLGYAVSGATRNEIFTDIASFKAQYKLALGTLLMDPNVKGVVANIPDVTGIPYFTTVQYNAITLDQEKVDALNAGYAEFNGAIEAYNSGAFSGGAIPDPLRPKIHFEVGANPIVIVDNDLADLTAAGIPSMRQMKAGELVVLSAATVLPTGIGTAEPAPDNLILTKNELDEITGRINAFNTAIADVVDEIAADRVAIVDINTAFNQLAAGGAFQDGVLLTAELKPPFGAFSEDGVHPNTRGYAFTANLFIEAINQKFGAKIPKLNLGEYPGTGLPQ